MRAKEEHMALQHHQTITVEEYFQLEEHSEALFEYVDGYIYAMAGGSANHDTIKSNLQRILWGLLRGGSCRAYTSDMKVPVNATRYYHPDVTVTCDSRDRGTVLALQSPCLVIEVLSPSTEMTDRTRKLRDYCAHPTIQEYLLVDSRAIRADLYHKENGKWIFDAFDANDEIVLNHLGVRFLLADAYVDVEFGEAIDGDDE